MMDVDNDIDGALLQQFSCMATQDKEVLVKQFQNLIGNQVNPESCAFYLDMNNWNLQAAICSYYDYNQQAQQTEAPPCMALIQDITIGEGESVPPNTPFRKTWRVKNTGQDTWPPGCCLCFIHGERFGLRDRVMVDSLPPSAEMDISVDMSSPLSVGMHQGQWRMQTPTGMFFGEIIWVILPVEENGLLGVTQQLSSFGSDLVHSTPSSPSQLNPFASPRKHDSESVTPVVSAAVSHNGNSSETSQQIAFQPQSSISEEIVTDISHDLPPSSITEMDEML